MTDTRAVEPRAIARRLAGGAITSLVRLFVVAAAGVIGTVVVARSVGPETWGVYAAAWSTVLLAGAAATHGIRDRLASDETSSGKAWTIGVWLSATLLGIELIAGAVAITVMDGESANGNIPLLVAAGVWLVAYPLRLPAMVGALRQVRPVRVMVLESIDAVVVPAVAVMTLASPGTTPLAAGIATSAGLALILSFAWGLPVAGLASPKQAARAWASARMLSLYQLAAVGRELVVPPVLLASAGASVAGAYGLALPLGAMVALGMSIAAQPALGALAALGGDDGRAAALTNIARRLLAALVAIGIPLLWLSVPPAVPLLFGSSWNAASTTIVVVMSAFAVTASAVPWVNVLIVRQAKHRLLLTAQVAGTLVILGGASAGGVIGSAGTAWVFLVVQVAFATIVGLAARSELRGIVLRDQLAFAGAAVVGTLVVIALPGAWAAAGPAIATAWLLLGSPRRPLLDSVAAVARSIRG